MMSAPLLPLRIVCATQLDERRFFETSLLGRSLTALAGFEKAEISLFPQNRLGLPAVYNRAIRAAAQNPALLVFVHDDVMICDFYWAAAVRDGLGTFDLIGLAGSTVRSRNQDKWFAVNSELPLPETGPLSGIVGHGSAYPPDRLSFFGPAPAPVKLLDGLFLAASSETLATKSMSFDERFQFHFYDLDFCRTAESKGLAMGTWPISVVHRSAGGYGSDAWKEARTVYLQKWGESL